MAIKSKSNNMILFRKWRERMDWTRSQAAVKLGVSAHTVKSYELARRPVPEPIQYLMKELEKSSLENGESTARSSIRIVGGGALAPISPNLAFCSPAYGSTARSLLSIIRAHGHNAELVLTKMADSTSQYETVSDLEALAQSWAQDRLCKMVFWNASVPAAWMDPNHPMAMAPDAAKSIIEPLFKRTDIVLILFVPTRGASYEEQIESANDFFKTTSAQFILANDSATRQNIVMDRNGVVLHDSFDRDTSLAALVSASSSLIEKPEKPVTAKVKVKSNDVKSPKTDTVKQKRMTVSL